MAGANARLPVRGLSLICGALTCVSNLDNPKDDLVEQRDQAPPLVARRHAAERAAIGAQFVVGIRFQLYDGVTQGPSNFCPLTLIEPWRGPRRDPPTERGVRALVVGDLAAYCPNVGVSRARRADQGEAPYVSRTHPSIAFSRAISTSERMPEGAAPGESGSTPKRRARQAVNCACRTSSSSAHRTALISAAGAPCASSSARRRANARTLAASK